MTQARHNNKKAFFLSSSLHAMMLFALLYVADIELKSAHSEAPQAMSLSCFTLPQVVHEPKVEPVVPVQKAQPKPKKVEPKQEVKKVIEKANPIEQVKEIVPVQEVVEEVIETQEVVEATEVVEEVVQQEVVAVASEQIQTQQQLQETYAQTNFEIIRALVLENLKYPSMAKRMGQVGVVQLVLVIDETGKLLDSFLEKSSGYKLLDKSALKAAHRLYAMELPKPQTLSKIVLPVEFAIN
jgi:protein TonB